MILGAGTGLGLGGSGLGGTGLGLLPDIDLRKHSKPSLKKQ